MKLLALLILLTLPGCAELKYWSSDFKYNIYEKKFELAPEDANLKYNIMENKWEFQK